MLDKTKRAQTCTAAMNASNIARKIECMSVLLKFNLVWITKASSLTWLLNL
jgi:hypothetical protein